MCLANILDCRRARVIISGATNFRNDNYRRPPQSPTEDEISATGSPRPRPEDYERALRQPFAKPFDGTTATREFRLKQEL
jgi:hypothetical protein